MSSRNFRRKFFKVTIVGLGFLCIIYVLSSDSDSDNFIPHKARFAIIKSSHQKTKIIKLSPVFGGGACNKNAKFLRFKDVIHPPKINGSEFKDSIQSFWNHIDSNEIQLASNDLSTIVQEQIDQIQRKSCQEQNLQCGHQDSCGFGCQIHHRIACLMMSYITQLPLIHTPDCDRWPYDKRWSDVFQPLGSPCAPGNNTIVWKWTDQFNDCENTTSTKTMPYPLTLGIPLDTVLGDLIEIITPNPFPWVVGQFAKYVMKLNTTFENKLQEWKTEIGFDNSKTPIVGIQVRRTDKILEAKDSRHSITVYMEEAEKYFERLESSKGLEKNSLPRKLFLASDNSSLLATTAQKYPDWAIMGFASNFSETFAGRRYGLFEIVRDVALLYESDFVVCGFSSNICRLVYEMQAFDQSESWDEQSLSVTSHRKLKSLDGKYNYVLLYHGLSPNRNMRIWKVDCTK